MKKLNVSLLIIAVVALPGCAANYGFKGPLEKVSTLGTPIPTPTPTPTPNPSPTPSPTPNPSPTPTPTPNPSPTPTPTPPIPTPTPPIPTPTPTPTPKPTPTPTPCTKKVWVYVKDVDAILAQAGVGSSKVYYCHAQKPDKVDLCALSKDFISVTNAALAPTWTANDYFAQLTYLLAPNTKGRVETSTGAFVCNLNIPSSLMGKILFKSTASIQVSTAKKVKFNFNEATAVIKTSSTECTLSVPAGGYSLYEN